MLGRLWGDEQGGVAILFLFLTMGLFGFVALSLDTSMWYSAKRRLQTAADSASRSGAFVMNQPGHRNDEIIQAVLADADRYQLPRSAFRTSINDGEGTVEVVISMAATLNFASLFLKAPPTLRARATAEIPNTAPPCLTLLDPSAAAALDMSGGGKILAPTCRIQVNSAAANAIHLGTGAYIAAAQICVAGGVSGTGSSVPPTTGCPPLVDPMASWVPPPVPACDHTKAFKYRAAIGSLQAGTYCADIVLDEAAVVTFSPGVYYLKDANLTISTASKAVGIGVAFLLTGSSKIYIDKLGQADFTAPISGPMAGIIFAHDDDAVPDKVHKLSDGVVRYEGAIYLPRQSAKYKASVTTNIPPFTTYIVKSMVIDGGSAVVLSNDYAASDVPLVGKIGAGVRLTK